MKHSLRIFLAIVGALNLVVLLISMWLFWLAPLQSDLDVRANFRQLDEAGVINRDALSKFHPSFGFETANLEYRNTVPRYLAAPALLAERQNAALAMFLSTVNVLGLAVALVLSRPRRLDRGDSASIGI